MWVMPINLQKIVRDFDLKESPWFEDTLKRFKIRKQLGEYKVQGQPATVDARERCREVHQVQGSVPVSMVKSKSMKKKIVK